jgi:hypothetical protein
MGFYEIGADIMGDEDMVISGQSVNAAHNAAVKAAGGQVLKAGQYSKARNIVAGFPTTAVAAAPGAAVIVTQPQRLFRPERLSIPDAIAEAFLVTALNIGTTNQFGSVDPVPGGVFKASAVGVVLKLDTAQVGNNISIAVTNITGGILNFNAALIGPAIE